MFSKLDVIFNKSDVVFIKSDIVFNKSDVIFIKLDVVFIKSDAVFNKSDVIFNFPVFLLLYSLSVNILTSQMAPHNFNLQNDNVKGAIKQINNSLSNNQVHIS